MRLTGTYRSNFVLGEIHENPMYSMSYLQVRLHGGDE